MPGDSLIIGTKRGTAWSAQQLFVALVPALVMFGLIAFAPSVIPDGDPYWHIAAGQWILEHGAVPRTDPFSHTFQGSPWTAHEWLTEVILASTYRIAGWSGLHVLVGFAGMATAFLLARELLKLLDPVPALAVLAFALANVAVAVHARPQFFTLPIIVFWLGELLEARRQERAPHWILIPLMVLWANLHGSFILGLALLGPFALEAAFAAGPNWRSVLRDWTLLAVGALLATLINPSGLEGLLFPFKLMRMSALSFIPEWSSATFNRIGPFEALLLALLFVCLMRGVRVPLIRLTLLLGMLHMALAHRRFAIVFAIGAALLMAEPIAAALKPRSNDTPESPFRLRAAAGAMAGLVIAGLAVVRLSIPVAITDNYTTPLSALASVPEGVLRQPVFNDYDFGGYLIFKGVRVFIDGRADMYGDTFMRDFGRLGEQDGAGINRTLAKYGATWAIVHTDHERGRFFDNLPGWRLHHRDEHASVYIRDTPTASGRPGLSSGPAQIQLKE